jgi:hypothetical protein
VTVAALGYGLLYRAYPQKFVQAFAYELDGHHFEPISKPLWRIGRFGLDPVQSGRTALALIRESPFLIVFAVLGLVVARSVRPKEAALFVAWLAIGSAYFGLQMYQPVRYFYLVTPALCYLAGLAIHRFGIGGGDRPAAVSRESRWVLAVYLAFNCGYLAMNAVANRGTMVQQVVAWAKSATKPSDPIMAAAFLCTDLPNRAYAHYKLSESPEQLLRSIRVYGVRYVIYDFNEWRPELGAALAKRFPVVQRWPFGVVYDVRARPTDGPPPAAAPATSSFPVTRGSDP